MGKHNITASWSNAANDTLVFLAVVDHDDYLSFIDVDVYTSNRHFSVVTYMYVHTYIYALLEMSYYLLKVMYLWGLDAVS